VASASAALTCCDETNRSGFETLVVTHRALREQVAADQLLLEGEPQRVDEARRVLNTKIATLEKELTKVRAANNKVTAAPAAAPATRKRAGRPSGSTNPVPEDSDESPAKMPKVSEAKLGFASDSEKTRLLELQLATATESLARATAQHSEANQQQQQELSLLKGQNATLNAQLVDFLKSATSSHIAQQGVAHTNTIQIATLLQNGLLAMGGKGPGSS